MFSAVKAQSDERVRQSRTILQYIRTLEEQNDRTIDGLVKVQKGLLFVSFYAAIEYSVINCVSQFLYILQKDPRHALRYKDYLICVVMDPQFKAITNSGKKTIWKKKAALIDVLLSEKPIDIDNTVLPTDGTNIGLEQLEDIWSFMHLPGDPIPEGFNSWYLGEIKQNRNAIAHGRATAQEIGKRHTVSELERRHDFASALCTHVISSFEKQVREEGYLRAS